MTPKKIILEDGKQPIFEGQWTVGEVLQISQQLAAWVQSLAVSPPQPQKPETAKDEK